MKKVIGIIFFFCLFSVVISPLKNLALNKYGIQTKAVILKYGMSDFEKDVNPNGNRKNYGLGNIEYSYTIKEKNYNNNTPLNTNNIYLKLDGETYIGDSIIIEYLKMFPSISRIKP